MKKLSVAVLASNRGGNLKCLWELVKKGALDARISILVTENPDAPVLKWAREHGLENVCIPVDSRTREEHEKEIMQHLKKHDVDLIVLDGYRRILSPAIVNAYRVMNVHPSLLPAFPGKNAWKQVLDHGAKVSGCTIHFVDESVDNGPIILQSAVPVMGDDTVETLKERILVEERRLYPEAVQLFAEGRLTIEGRRVIIKESA
ncbi:MAG: phosphoribosylglycinamide formyltransferase [Methanosarcinales archaeon Met12]|nr:MAG: phosphoribosylglycinamide formyltransferase [Methanosarcinales archaeon Met12]